MQLIDWPLPCLLLALAAHPAQAAEDWRTIPTDHPNIGFAIDVGNLERFGAMVKFWEKLTYARPEVRDEASGLLIKEKKVRRLMHCAYKTQGLLQGTTYGEGGRFITSISVETAEVRMTPIPPNTIASAEFDLLCPPAASP